MSTAVIAVIGDVMLDHFVVGRVDRISPEAPVPVVRFQRDDYRLGGAANVAANVRSLGALARLVRETRFGSIEIVVHEGRITQIERRERVRFAAGERQR